MNTLHLYHWQNEQDFLAHLNLLTQGDGLVIYGTDANKNFAVIDAQLAPTHINWYIVKLPHEPHICEHNINHDQWLNLMIQYQNTLAWK